MIHQGDCLEVLKTLPDSSVHCCITSPPYFGLRDYGVEGQIGLEPTPEAFVARLVEVFREVRRVLRKDGTLWLNLGDTYNGLKVGSTQENVGAKRHNTSTFRKELDKSIKPKDLIGIPWRVAFALQSDGWYLRQDIIWAKPNPMPESVKDRCTKAHEYLFLLSKSARYYFDAEAIKEPSVGESPVCRMRKHDGLKQAKLQSLESGALGTPADGTRNRRSVWTVGTRPYKGAHFATFPPKLIEPCILAGCPAGGVVLDPFFGAGTTGMVAMQHGRGYVGIELNPEYVELAKARISEV